MPDGFLGVRGNLLTDFVFVCNLVAPIWAVMAAGAARRGEHERHMRLQMGLWMAMLANLFLLEGLIRLSGGSGSLMGDSPWAGTTVLEAAFLVHVVPAVATYLLWSWLVIVTYRRWRKSAMAPFAPRHRMLGKVVIAGLVWTAISSCFVYYLTFAAT
jgi:hypothetical protein